MSAMLQSAVVYYKLLTGKRKILAVKPKGYKPLRRIILKWILGIALDSATPGQGPEVGSRDLE